MPIRYDINLELGLVLTTASGVLTGAELRQFKKALLDDPRFRLGMRELSDVRQITELAVTSEDVEALMAIDETYADRMESHELGLLVGSDVSFGMARMYQMRSDREDRIAVFRDEAAARAWLDRPRTPSAQAGGSETAG